MPRIVRKPQVGVEYTFRRLNKKTGKVVYDTYRFTGEITEKGRFVFYEVHYGSFMDCTLEGFSYMMRKRFVRKKDVNGKISTRVQEITPIEKILIDKGTSAMEANRSYLVQNDKANMFLRKALAELSNFTKSEILEIEEKTGVKIEYLKKLFLIFLDMPDGPAKNNAWNSLMKKYLKVASVSNTTNLLSLL